MPLATIVKPRWPRLLAYAPYDPGRRGWFELERSDVPYAQVGDIELYYEVHGDGRPRTVILVPGRSGRGGRGVGAPLHGTGRVRLR